MKKQRTLGAVPVERSSGKRIPTWVYADSDGMLFKAQLAAKIAVLVHHRRLTQTHAEIPGLTQPKVCALLKGRSCCVSEHRLLKCLTRLGATFTLSSSRCVEAAPAGGTLSVA